MNAAHEPTRLIRNVFGPARHSSATRLRASRRPWQVRGGPRHAPDRCSAADVLSLLRSHHDGLVRIERLFTLLSAREIALDRGRRAKFIGPEDRLESRIDFCEEVLLD